MKRYYSIGELLVDYRSLNNLSQSEFASFMNVDTRTIQRWERNETLLKSEKEEEIVVKTLLPYQLIRNLNGLVAIPTFYDFSVRKYSLTELSNDLPEAELLKKKFQQENNNIRKIDIDFDIPYLKKYLDFQKKAPNNIIEAIKKAIPLLPELNLIITDDSGYYSGHSIVFPINSNTYKKLRAKEIREDEITSNDIVDYKKEEQPIFYNYEISADCNDNTYFLSHQLLKFFSNNSKLNYLYATYAIRYDSFKLNQQLGLKIVWEDSPIIKKDMIKIFPRFYEGNFKAFLKDFSQ
jgi:transcriptional regulator with XRE-family HTH domain